MKTGIKSWLSVAPDKLPQHTPEPELNETFDLAYRFVTETAENIFLTGKAGTGKTTFLKYLGKKCSKNMVVGAPTGVAAINAGGVTLHSLFQLPLHPFLPVKKQKEELLARIRYNKQRRQLLLKMELLVIDEISMVRCDTLDAIDTILRSVRRNHQLPFGGVQLLFIGDLFQLPPVAQKQEWEMLKEFYSSPFFFDSLVIREQVPLLIELSKVYRQKDGVFLDLLNKVRNNRMNSEDLDALNQRSQPLFVPPAGENYITLTSHNQQADRINQRELQILPGAANTFDALIVDDFPENNFPAERSLQLKPGAQVMFLRNDTVHKKYFNGKIGVVVSLEEDRIIVECDGMEIDVQPETWENIRYAINSANGKLEQKILGSFTQFPLRLAWAITIHKSQGLTFEKVMIDAAAAFSSGQVYVALSRCVSLEGIVLLSKIPATAIYNNEHIIKGQQEMDGGSLPVRFDTARQIFSEQLMEEIFSFHRIYQLTGMLAHRIKTHHERINASSLDWMNQLALRIASERNVGLKFISTLGGFMRLQPVVEKNEPLQKRITAAAKHFHPLVTAWKKMLEEHPVETDFMETAADIDEMLGELFAAIHTEAYHLEYCFQPFEIPHYLDHKLKYITPRIHLTSYAGRKKRTGKGEPGNELLESLKRWRNQVCERTGQPVYLVANQAALQEIATWLPMTKDDLVQLSGFGKTKADRYGEEILSLVEEYCDRNGLPSNMANKPGLKRQRKKASASKTDTKAVTFALFRQGKNQEEIARERGLSLASIQQHLRHYVSTGHLALGELLPAEKVALILEAIKQHGAGRAAVLKEVLPPEIAYGDINFVMASVNAEKSEENGKIFAIN